MARALILKLGDEESRFGILKVDREKLYGRKQRVIVDEENRPCAPAWLTADGSALVPLGGTAHVWTDERWAAVETEGRRAVDEAGQPLAEVASTLEVAQVVEPVSPETLLAHVTDTVYELDAELLGDQMKDALARGNILSCPFSYRGGHAGKDGLPAERAFILQNDAGVFALVGRPTGFQPLSREILPSPDEDDELEADLDFSML